MEAEKEIKGFISKQHHMLLTESFAPSRTQCDKERPHLSSCGLRKYLEQTFASVTLLVKAWTESGEGQEVVWYF